MLLDQRPQFQDSDESHGGPLPSESRQVHACSQRGQIQTHDTSPASGRRKRPPFFLLVLPLSCWASGSSPQARESTIAQGQALPSPTPDARWGQAAALRSRTLHPQGACTQGLPRALPWVQECPAWPPHHAAPRCDLRTQLPTCLLTTGIHLCEGITWAIRYPSSEFLHWLRACFSSLQSGTLTVSLLLLYYKPQPAPSPPPQSTSPMAFLSTWSQREK